MLLLPRLVEPDVYGIPQNAERQYLWKLNICKITKWTPASMSLVKLSHLQAENPKKFSSVSYSGNGGAAWIAHTR